MREPDRREVKVIYSIATKIGGAGLGTVSYNAVKALDGKDYLDMAVSYGNKSDIRKSRKLSLPGNPAKLLFFLPRHYYGPLRKGFLDYITSRVILKRGCDLFHGWNNQALKSIKAAKSVGAKTILECGSTHRLYKEARMAEEHSKFGIENKKVPGYAREASLEELDRADFIFLPSEFARKTFVEAGVSDDKLFVINRGVALERFTPSVSKEGRFKVLFAGRISLRKGVQYLLEAWKGLDLSNAELTLIGSIDDKIKPVLSHYRNISSISFRGFLKNSEEVFRESTIFVFPSLEEGSAKVTYEAMASGLPVITTENSGSVVRDGLDGFIIPVNDIEAIRDKIKYFFNNPSEAARMGQNAAEHAKSYTWGNYRTNLINAYEKILAG